MTLQKDEATVTSSGSNLSLLQQISRTYYDLLVPFERYMGMSRARWHMLSLLSRAEQLSQAQLSQQLRIDGAAVTRQVKQLQEDGLITRKADPQDNRFTLVALTPQGQTLVEGLRNRRDMFEERVTAGLEPDEVATVERCLAHIRDNIAIFQREI